MELNMDEENKGCFGADIFKERRNRIRPATGEGVALWLGNSLQPRNYVDNHYPFRQNSHFLYLAGLSEPDLAVISYPDPAYDVLFAKPATIDDTIWGAAGLDRVELARRSGIETVEPISRLGEYLEKAGSAGMQIHYLPPYQDSSLRKLAGLLQRTPDEVLSGVSEALVLAVVEERLVKSAEEVARIEAALEVTDRMHRAAMAAAAPGVYEYEIAGIIQGIALGENCRQSFNPIVTTRGEVLHNTSYDNLLRSGQLMLIDAGAEEPGFYASDITRTFPVDGAFTSVQKEIYEIVLSMQIGAIARMKPGITYRDVHLHAAGILAESLCSMGLMKGNPAQAVEAGAHALFFPHGLGHMMGLDVHDMEDLGDAVGYPMGEARESQFGLNALRLARSLEPGHVITVEPGIYFIPALIDRWKQERLHAEFIEYEKVEKLCGFGGIRIEDDVLVTEAGVRVLGPGIPKTVDEVEAACRRG
jgi:Xaa-Pro aminopeptidase